MRKKKKKRKREQLFWDANQVNGTWFCENDNKNVSFFAFSFMANNGKHCNRCIAYRVSKISKLSLEAYLVVQVGSRLV